MAKLSIDDIANVSFHKASIGGYKPEEVDEFIDNVQESFEHLNNENQELVRKLGILAKKVEEYRQDEDSIRSTLLNAQKLASASIREAKHKSEVIIRDANAMAEKIVAASQDEVLAQQDTIKSLQNEVVKFRAKLLNIYKGHLRLIDALPTEEDFKTDNEKMEIKDFNANKLNDKVETEKVEEKEPDTEIDNIDTKTSAVEEKSETFNNMVDDVVESIENGISDTKDLEEVVENNQVVRDELPILEEPQTIKFDAIKFGENYEFDKEDEN